MKRKIKWLFFLNLIFIYKVSLAAQNSAGTVQFLELRSGGGVRALAMGEAFVGLADCPETIFYNPAGGVNVRKEGFFTSYENKFLDSSRQELIYLKPTDIGSFSFALVYSGIKNIPCWDENNSYQGVFSDKVYFGTFNWASEILTSNFLFGAGLKYHREYVQDYFFPPAVGIDFGCLYKLNKDFSFGVSLQNVGKDLPSIGRCGCSFSLPGIDVLSLDLSFLKDFSPYLSFGMEKEFFQDNLFLRCGAKINSQNYTLYNFKNIFSFGFGIKIKEVILDYAFFPVSDLGICQKVGLGFFWGPPLKTVKQIEKEQEEIIIQEKQLVEAKYQEGLEAYLRGDFEKTIILWEEVLKICSDKTRYQDLVQKIDNYLTKVQQDIYLTNLSKQEIFESKEEIPQEEKKKEEISLQEPSEVKQTPVQSERETKIILEKQEIYDFQKADKIYYEGLSYYMKKDYKKAEQLWKEVIQIYPQHQRAKIALQRLNKENEIKN